MAEAMYLRKSRVDLAAERHGAGDTLARHQQALLAVAQANGLDIGKIYRETKARPRFLLECVLDEDTPSSSTMQ